MKLKIEINMDNAAFKEAGDGVVVARILAHLAEVSESGDLGFYPGATMPLRDIDGKKVGEARVTR